MTRRADRGERPIDRTRFDALLFDLDGVLTKTAAVHARAWTQTFDEFLTRWSTDHDTAFVPFDPADDYTIYVDGKPRYDGVQSFLASRGINLPWGTPDDPPGDDTICAVGNRKNDLVLALIRSEGVEAYDDGVALLVRARAQGFKTAVVSSSKNCLEVITAVGIADDFDVRLDGHAVEEGGLAGKPAPDTYLAAATELGVDPARAVVLEDAVAGVQAGRAGHFGLVVGVDRKDDADELRANGADVTSDDLASLLGE
jgi:beta-phosphoglucomutase family hydrolase